MPVANMFNPKSTKGSAMPEQPVLQSTTPLHMPSVGRFDPTPGQDYGYCLRCAALMVTETDALTHRVSPGHVIKVTNPSRPERLRREISTMVDEAMRSLCEQLDQLVDDKYASPAEINDTLMDWPGVTEYWDDHRENP